jgi:hypothetical protein
MAWERKKIRRSKKQQIWTFMRRNRVFRAGDLMMILEVDQGYLLPIFRALELCGYLSLESGTEVFKDRVYRLVCDTGVRSPSILKKPHDTVKDLNTNEAFILNGNHPVQMADKLTLLYALKHETMFREQIAVVAKMHIYSARMIRYLAEFNAMGIMSRTSRSHEGRRLFNINMEKRDDLIRTLEKSLHPALSA